MDNKAYRFEVRPVEGGFEHAHEVLVLALQHAYTRKTQFSNATESIRQIITSEQENRAEITTHETKSVVQSPEWTVTQQNNNKPDNAA